MEVNEKVLILTVGLPRSGKTTWARGQSIPIVSPDSIRLALHGQRFVGLAEPFVWAIARLMARALFLAGHDTVIVDATSTTKQRRDEWRSKDWRLAFQNIPTSTEECLKRAEAEGDDYIIPIIKKMSDQFEPVSDDERV
jgi:predicted kinase